MEIVKDIAVIISLILSTITLITVFAKGGKTFIKNIFEKYSRNN